MGHVINKRLNNEKTKKKNNMEVYFKTKSIKTKK